MILNGAFGVLNVSSKSRLLHEDYQPDTEEVRRMTASYLFMLNDI